MAKVLEIRWHGRGGQGAKTAALLFGEAALETGKYIQAFPEYGPERMGAPVTAFNRLSEEPIYSHSGIKNPDIVVVLDPSLIEPARVTEGLKPGGILLVNTAESPDSLRERLGLPESVRVYTVDASTIAMETVGKDVPNTPMLGALARVTGVLELEPMIAAIRSKLSAKFRGREKLVEDNLQSIRRAFAEVKGLN
ncbi:MAG: 2-oxoacid:acceptor oxidoreductase family protein [candidate division WOR-3 bacterium]|uniref:Pyruvate synthase n=1 Tax=candidate division WOR-3 bacterium TaxID=2052148 RepID=A0A7C3EPW4_UNCW3|nr:2-oxoacid:acceptor oxidoreductase family protein [candidate division WOR-3 bacterium]